MQFLLDYLLVGVVLSVSVVYALFSLGPRSLRGRLLKGTSAVLRRLPAVPGVRGLADRLQAAAAVKAAGSCGGCGSCESEQPSAAPTAGPEVRIPVSKIGKR